MPDCIIELYKHPYYSGLKDLIWNPAKNFRPSAPEAKCQTVAIWKVKLKPQ